MNPTDTNVTVAYGCEQLGRLRRVMLHCPGRSLELVTGRNCHDWLFDAAPDPAAFIEEHRQYRRLLESCGVEVLELTDHLSDGAELVARLPNLTYLHDTAVVHSRGALLSRMAPGPRRGEETLVREALETLGVPIAIVTDGQDDAFEGALQLSPDTLLIADTERHTDRTIRQYIQQALGLYREIIHVKIPKARRFMHPDMIYNRIRDDLALAFPPAFLSTRLHTAEGVRDVDFLRFMQGRGVEIVPVSEEEQKNWGCSFVPLEPGVIIHYDIALRPETRRRLERRGVELVLFHPRALLAGGGSLRCLTLRLQRERRGPS